MSSKKNIPLLCVFVALCILLAGAFVLVAHYHPEFMPFRTQEVAPDGIAENEPAVEDNADNTFPVWFMTPDEAGENIEVRANPGEAFEVPEGPAIKGYTFIGWKDAFGNIVRQAELTLDETSEYTAVYQIAFKDESGEGVHEAYLSLDEGQRFNPDKGLTKREFVKIVYKLLDTDACGSGYFIDLSEEDDCYTAAATLKDLGLIGGNRLHPDETITFGEFYSALMPLFPDVAEKYDFERVTEADEYYKAFCFAKQYGILTDAQHASYDIVSRYEAVRIFNKLTGRKCMEHADCTMTGTIPDIVQTNAMFPDVADAVVTHTCTLVDGQEIWSDSEPYPFMDEGFYFLGSELHCIGADGMPVVNASYGGLDFDSTGAQTSGDHELDLLVRAKIAEICDPETQDTLEMLEALYNDLTYNSEYLRINSYKRGEHGWEAREAYQMLANGKGNCYTFAGTLWALARGIGFDAKAYSGTVDINESPHGWVEIEIDGANYIFDAALQYEERYFHYSHSNFYMKTPKQLEGWNYIKYGDDSDRR